MENEAKTSERRRSTYYSFDRGTVDAMDKAIEACRLGDVPDMSLGIIGLLKMYGYDIVKRP